MPHHFATPGVYIEEVTSPGVIAGVGTSTAAFVGPAWRGPVNEVRRIFSFDEFLRLYAIDEGDGTFWPYLNTPRWFYMALGVRGFFENGGADAYIVRVGTARAAAWDARNQGTEAVFRIQASEEGVAGNNLQLQVQTANATGANGVNAAKGSAQVQAVNGLELTLAANGGQQFRVGDTVTEDETARATVTRIVGDVLTVSQTIANLVQGNTLRVGNVTPAQRRFRLATTAGVYPGSVVRISGVNAANNNQASEYGVVESLDQAGFVTLAQAPQRAVEFSLTGNNNVALTSQEFRLIVTPPGGAAAETFDNLSLNPLHPNYVFSAVNSNVIRILPPSAPPTASSYPNALINTALGNQVVLGQDDNPAALTSTEYMRGLAVLQDIDDVNIVCIPDAAAHPECMVIQQAMINHCLQPGLQDRFAILDSRLNAVPFGPGSVDEHRGNVQSARGFAALYYPWLQVPEPIRPPRARPTLPPSIFIPPSGHIAGVYARVDSERGVHKAPANVEVRGVLGLERRLSDGQQGPLNLKGVNVLRVFPGSGQVMVWGARTTVDPNITDWRYVNIRRLMLYLEESIAEGIRWAVFEPNNLTLWQKLRRTISEFLRRVWRDGALFGATADDAFYVRIDEGLNPDSTRALGRLYIEVGVRPSYPAEFIVVRIGLWQGKTEVTES